jgi:hypothetical protein
VEAAVVDLCKREDKLDVRARRVGRTLYAQGVVKGLVDASSEISQAKLGSIEKILRKLGRVSLSSDADFRYLVAQVRDEDVPSGLRIIQSAQDFRGAMNMRLSPTDMQDRIVFEWGKAEGDGLEEAHDISPVEFLARLCAWKVARRITQNPLLGAVLDFHKIEGRADGGAMVLEVRLVASGESGHNEGGSQWRLIGDMVRENAAHVLATYAGEGAGEVERVRLVDEREQVLWEGSPGELSARTVPAKKSKKDGDG